MAERDNAGGGPGSEGAGSGLEGLLRGIGDLLHRAADISSDRRRAAPDGTREPGRRPWVESRMTVRGVDGEAIGADFFGLREVFAAAAAQDAEVVPPSRPERREPPVEVIAALDSISAIVELPGAEPDTIVAGVEHDMLTISASGCGIEYAAEALLPAPVADQAREQSFRNGVLELKWPRAEALA